MACKNPEVYLIINVLPETDQQCLIYGTTPADQEEAIINKHIRFRRSTPIIVYGRNCTDDKVYTKAQQLGQLGFANVLIYCGGLFEWLILQDIYGSDEFPTTSKQLDFLRYKSRQRLNVGLIEDA